MSGVISLIIRRLTTDIKNEEKFVFYRPDEMGLTVCSSPPSRMPGSRG